MKVRLQPQARQARSGFFLIIVLLIVASLLLGYAAANTHRLAVLKQQLKLIEANQLERVAGVTNRVAAAAGPVQP